MKENDDAVLMWNGVPVLTTMMLSERIGIVEANIRKNYSKNKDRFEVGADYLEVKGPDLKKLRKELHNLKLDRYQIDPKTPFLYLWTEKGAHSHAKIGESNGAWEAFLHLRNGYFRQKQALKAIKEAHDLQSNPLFVHTMRPVQLTNSKEANRKNYEEGGKKQIMEYNLKSCVLHSQMTTKQVKLFGLKMGLTKTICKNAKEVLRRLKPEITASMSITDQLRSYGGKLEEIAPLSVAAQPLLAKMYELGAIDQPKRLAS